MANNNYDCVRVAVRLRPLVKSETNRGCQNVIDCCVESQQVMITDTPNGTFAFNYVFPPEISQASVYEESVRNMIKKLFEGYNVTILAYGQTGSGKTFTMGTNYDGNEYQDEVGVIPRAMIDIFNHIKQMESSDYEFDVTCSFMELYQEILFDLLSEKDRQSAIVDIREDGARGIVIPQLTEVGIKTAQEATDCLMKGSAGRKVGATAMNAVSSRSHAIFTVNLTIKHKNAPKSSKTAKFNLVDLAGSERSKKTQATGERFKEGVKINQGLLALGNVISALGGGSGSNQTHIPYRDSKLTRLLQDSLGGNSLTLMIACASPADYNTEETLSTLRYADRAKKIKNKPIINQDPRTAEIKALKEVIQKLQLQILNQNSSGTHYENMGDNDNYNDLKAKFDDAIQRLKLLNKELESTVNDVVHLNIIVDNSERALEDITKTVNVIKETNILPDELREHFDKLTDILEKYQATMTEMNDNTHNSRESYGNESHNDEQLQTEIQVHTNKQIGLKNELGELQRRLALKVELHRKIQLNSTYICQSTEDISETNRKITEYEQRISELETELANANNKKVGKISEDRRVRLQQMETELAQLRKKLVNQTKQLKANEDNVKRVNVLNKEIIEMKATKVKLVRSMRQESENFRQYKLTKQKEVCQLKAKDVKLVNEMKRKDNLYEKQHRVMKRKVEEVAAVNKRLKDLLDRRQHKLKVAPSNSDSKSKRTSEDFKSWIDNELELIVSIVDAKVTIKQLMDERATIKERLIQLKSTTITYEEGEENQNEKAIADLEMDLSVRNAQISDLQQKIIESDIDSKIKAFASNSQTPDQSKIMIRHIVQTFVSLRHDFAGNRLKFSDLMGALELSDETNLQNKQELDEYKKLYEDKLSEMEKMYEDKLCFFTTKLERNEQSINRYKSYLSAKNLNDLSLNRSDCLEESYSTNYQERVKELRKEIEERDLIIAELKENGQRRKRKHPKLQDEIQEHYEEVEEEEEMEDDLDFNDSLVDPSYHGTPYSRRTRSKNTTLVRDILLMNAVKRSVDGKLKCGCKKNCSTNKCSCSKKQKFCNSNCHCPVDCVNRNPNGSDDDAMENNSSKRTTISIPEEINENDQNDSNLSKNTPKKFKSENDSTSYLDVTTPRYVYSIIKRKPFLVGEGEADKDSVTKEISVDKKILDF